MSWVWTGRKEQAALALALDEESDAAIAARLGVVRITLAKWKLDPEFQARLKEHKDAWRTEVRAHGIAIREKRIEALNKRWDLMWQVIAERAVSPEFANVAGGKTGLMVRTVKVAPGGVEVKEFAVDTGLLAEMRAHEKQSAQELGQWVDKGELTGKEGEPLFKVYLGIDVDRV